MKSFIWVVTLLLMVPAWGSAEEADDPIRGEAYFFIAPIVSNARPFTNPAYYGVVFHPGEPLPANLTLYGRGGVNAGFGGDVLIRNGLGVGFEAGYAGQDWSFGANGLGVGSINATYHFFGNKTSRRVDPFATGGYSLYFGDRTAFQNGFNLGGGVNVWWVKHVALRLEVLDQDNIKYFHSQFTRFAAFRVGMTFR